VLLESTFPDRHALARIPGGNAPADASWPASAIPITTSNSIRVKAFGRLEHASLPLPRLIASSS
jgi:hypothetical protein